VVTVLPYSFQRIETIRHLIREALRSGRANDWEQKFLRDMDVRFERFHTQTRLSEKQYKTLARIIDLPADEAPQVKPATPYKARTAPRAARPQSAT
tara:strand:- start:3126 stop:3413 length:288 start_codon:yes stop_codon:yes gene_type:complete